MTPPETGALDVVLKLAPIVAASGIWVFGAGMLVQNWRRAKAERRRVEAEKNRHTESMEADRRRAEVEKNRHTESMEADQRRAEAEKNRHTESMEADRRRHEEAMTALTELIRRTSSPPRPGPAE